MPRRLEYNFKWEFRKVVENSKKQKEMELRKNHPKWNYRKMKEKTKKQEEKQYIRIAYIQSCNRKGGSADMWRIVIRFVEIVSNSNRRIGIKDMCGF